MTISLTIDSVDALPDGGPIRYQARNRSFEIGRQQHLDWTLPDPSRHISGQHCEVRFEKGGYWLYDVSRNGTFLNGSTSRMKSPYLLADGDRLTIGNYIVRVEIEAGPGEGQDERNPEPLADYRESAAYTAPTDDIWDAGAPAPPPLDRRALMPEPPDRRRAADYANQFIDFPASLPSRLPAGSQPSDPFGSPFDAPPALPPAEDARPSQRGESPFGPAPEPLPVPTPRSPPAPAIPFEPPPRPRQVPGESESFSSGNPVLPPAAAAPFAAEPMPAPAPRPANVPNDQQRMRFLEGLAAGAGVKPEIFASRDPGELGFEIGESLKVAVEQLAQLLRARAAAKAMTKSSSRTMIGATDNNPLKFIPGAAEIIDVMFTRRRPGFLGAKQSLEAGFNDLKRHELATYAAMQKALSRLLDDFSPEAISAKVGNSVLSSKKSRSWDVFVERWEQKSGPHDNGMLDVFLAYFAEAYDEASRKG